MKPSAHMHLLVRAEILNPPGPNDCQKINEFMSGLVEHVRMTVMLDPVTAWCSDEGNEGITSTVILTTSHCAMHIWNNDYPTPSIMQFDLYSCASFTIEEVFEYINKHFYVLKASYKFLDRENDLTEINTGSMNYSNFSRDLFSL